jgi:DNA-directed RNA polymerase subunit RPC12/RpoP
MKELISTAGDEPDASVDKLINECVLDEGFDVKNLSLQDRFFFLVELRKKSKGSKYEVTYKCSECSSQVIALINLDDLKVKKLDKNFDRKIVLDSNITVEVDFITRGIQKEADDIVKSMVESGEVKEDDMYVNEIVFSYILAIKKIITPDGVIENPTMEEKLSLFKEGPQSFYDEIIKWFNKLDFGIDFTTTTKCFHCGKETVESITMQNFFY